MNVVFNLENLNKTSNPFFIDLILTNKNEFLKNFCAVEVGISDHHL